MAKLARALVLGRFAGPHDRIHGDQADPVRCGRDPIFSTL
jgi:hypothetical protein